MIQYFKTNCLKRKVNLTIKWEYKVMKIWKNKNMKKIENENWKATSPKYLKELQTFLDKSENIQNEDLRKEIIFQMLKCDKELTDLAEEMFSKYYLRGKEKLEEDD